MFNMKVDIKIDEGYLEPEIVIYTKEINDEISKILQKISKQKELKIQAYKDDIVYLIEEKNIETVYCEYSKVYVRLKSGETYLLKKRIYEMEEILDKEIFIRISNSEIVNFKMIKNLDLKMIGTIILNFESGRNTYVSRRYMKKIKEFLDS